MTKKYQERRNFLKKAAYAAVAGSSISAMSGKFSLLGSALAQGSSYQSLADYKALVCVFLYGGSDSYNMFVPNGSLYSNYAEARRSLALRGADLISAGNGDLSFHHNLRGLRDLYDRDTLAVYRNIGNLIEPIRNQSHYERNPSIVPSSLMSHSHQQEQVLKGWSSRPSGSFSSGWGGRMADLLDEANLGSELNPCFSMNNSNFWLPGDETSPVSINPMSGPTLFRYLDERVTNNDNSARGATMTKILGLNPSNKLQRFARDSHQSALDSSRLLVDSLGNLEVNTDDNSVAVQLEMVAKMIEQRNEFPMKRQIFFVGSGGWDTHANQVPRLNALTSTLNEALVGFQSRLSGMGMADQVTTFTASDFGRSFSINAGGTDHGWGGHYAVMGGSVRGGRMYGDWPSYVVGGADDAEGTGQVIPTTSINEYGATLADWLGLTQSDILDVFPDLRNFDDSWASSNLFN